MEDTYARVVKALTYRIFQNQYQLEKQFQLYLHQNVFQRYPQNLIVILYIIYALQNAPKNRTLLLERQDVFHFALLFI